MTRLRWLLLLAPFCVSAQQRLPATYAVAPTVSLRIWVPSGKVRLESWDRDSIRVSGTIGRNSSYFGGGSGAGAKFGVENMDPKDTRLAEADLVVTVPRRARVWVKMTDGTFSGQGGGGELEVITVAGAITVTGATGVVAVETIDASVTLSQINGAVRVNGGGGRVSLSDIHGTLTATTVSGSLEYFGKVLSDAFLRTIGGTLTLRGGVEPKSLIELETHNGTIDLQVPAGSLPSLRLSTRTGTVRNAFGKENGFIGSIIARSFKGDINVRSLDGIERRKTPGPP
jgi:DUF4097 and DUF4098 domain-containing protein YvlB